MKLSNFYRLSGLVVATLVQVSALSAQANYPSTSASAALPSDLKITCTIGVTATGHGGPSGFEDVVMIDFGKIQTGYETTGLVVKTTNFAFGDVSEVGYRVAAKKNVGGNLYFVSGKANGAGSYSFLLQKDNDTYRFVKVNPNAQWGDELYTADCVSQN